MLFLMRAAPHAAAQLQVSSSCRRYPTLLERQLSTPPAVDRQRGKMKSTALEKNTTGSASPRRTIVPSLATASSVILVISGAAQGNGKRRKPTVGRNGAGQIEFWISTRVENSAIFGGPFFAWHR